MTEFERAVNILENDQVVCEAPWYSEVMRILKAEVVKGIKERNGGEGVQIRDNY